MFVQIIVVALCLTLEGSSNAFSITDSRTELGIEMSETIEPVSEKGLEIFETIEHVSEKGLELFKTIGPVSEKGLEIFKTIEPVSEKRLEIFETIEPVSEEGLEIFETIEPVSEKRLEIFKTIEPELQKILEATIEPDSVVYTTGSPGDNFVPRSRQTFDHGSYSPNRRHFLFYMNIGFGLLFGIASVLIISMGVQTIRKKRESPRNVSVIGSLYTV